MSSIKVSNVNRSDTVAPYFKRRENEKFCLVALFIQSRGFFVVVNYDEILVERKRSSRGTGLTLVSVIFKDLDFSYS